MQVINKNQFKEQISKDNITVVDYFAVWCGPCRMMHPVLEAAEKKYTNFTFVQIDIDKDPELSILNNVQAVPTIVAYKNGKEIKRTMGYTPEGEFDYFLTSLK